MNHDYTELLIYSRKISQKITNDIKNPTEQMMVFELLKQQQMYDHFKKANELCFQRDNK